MPSILLVLYIIIYTVYPCRTSCPKSSTCFFFSDISIFLLRKCYTRFFFSEISIFPNLYMPWRHAPWIRQPSHGSLVHSHRDFRFRRSVVYRALNWLVTHNQYYRSNHVHIDVNALEQLPHDGNLSQLTAITIESAITEPPATNTPATGPPVAYTPATFEDPYSAHLPQSCFHCHSIYDRAGGSASVCSGATIKPIHLIIACHHDVASI